MESRKKMTVQDFTRLSTIRNAGKQAMDKSAIENYNKLVKQWDTAFSMYTVVVGSAMVAAENALTNLLPKIRPSKALREEFKQQAGGNKKKEKQITLDHFPFYYQELKKEMNYLAETGVQFYEKFMYKNVPEERQMVNILSDAYNDILSHRCFILRMSVKAELDKQNLPNSDLRAEVYATYQLFLLALRLHRGLMAIGPREEWIYIQEDSPTLGIVELMRQYPQNGMCPTYSVDWDNRMKDACPALPTFSMADVNRAVNGEWKHKEDGAVAVSLNGLLATLTSVKFLHSVNPSDAIKESGYDVELELIKSIEPYKTGGTPITFIVVKGVHLMRQGMDTMTVLKEIRKTFRALSVEHVNNLVVTTEICRAVLSGKIDVDIYNREMLRVREEKGGSNGNFSLATTLQAVQKVIDYQEQLKNENEENADSCKKSNQLGAKSGLLRAKKVTDSKLDNENAEIGKKSNQLAAKKVTNSKPKDEKQELVDLLASKFGNVSKQKEKKPKEQPKPKMQLTHPEPSPILQHANVRWTETEENNLRDLWGRPVDQIARCLGRSEASIKAKARRLDLKPVKQSTNKLFK